MTIENFLVLAKEYNLIPVYKIITADMLTPVLAYLKIRETGKSSFLLESVEGSINMARFSFIAKEPELLIMNKKENVTILKQDLKEELKGNIFEIVRNELKKYKQPVLPDLPDFTGGITGFIGYENISLIEPTVVTKAEGFGNYDSILGLYKTIIAFDHYKHQVILINNVFINENSDLVEEYNNAINNLKRLNKDLQKNAGLISDFKITEETTESISNEEFHKYINKSKQHIVEGDIFQIVLSKRFQSKFNGDTFNVYRALRTINPSPYMYYYEFPNNFSIMGTSPENLIKVKRGIAELLPIAGTRRRGRTDEEDLSLEENLMADTKELAEHTMLVDLGRNDLGRVCDYGTVEVVEHMKVQRYSHVMHIVSKVQGKMRKDKDVIDALLACFPAGTVTGAPKIKAMQLIEDFENLERNVYAGAVGYFDFSGNMDMCIAIRTLFAKDNTIFWQAGAGLVADSKPELETKEINNKAAVMVKALKYAEVIDENFGD